MKRERVDIIKTILTYLFFAILLPGISILVIYFVARNGKLTPLESALMQLIEILAVVASTYFFSKKAAETIIQDRARLALRRIFTLYTFFPRIIDSIKQRQDFLTKVTSKDGKIDKNFVTQAMDSIMTQAYEQIGTVNDAVDDWKDLVPDPEEVLRKYKEEGGKS